MSGRSALLVPFDTIDDSSELLFLEMQDYLLHVAQFVSIKHRMAVELGSLVSECLSYRCKPGKKFSSCSAWCCREHQLSLL